MVNNNSINNINNNNNHKPMPINMLTMDNKFLNNGTKMFKLTINSFLNNNWMLNNKNNNK